MRREPVQKSHGDDLAHLTLGVEAINVLGEKRVGPHDSWGKRGTKETSFCMRK